MAERSVQELRARNDKLAAELCALRGFVVRIADLLDYDQLDEDSARIITNVRQTQIAHRQHDRAAHVDRLNQKIAVLEGRMKLIRNNGGLVHPKQIEEMAELVKARDHALALTADQLLGTDIGF